MVGYFQIYKHLEFFDKIQRYINSVWDEFENKGSYKCKVSRFVYTKENLDNMNPQKLFNYILQNLETSTNALILWEIFRVLRGCKTKLVLYTYDSFLFDFSEDEPEVLELISGIFKEFNLNIKQTEGYDYNFTE